MNQALVFVLVSAFFVGTRCFPQEPMTENPQVMITTIMSAPVGNTSNLVTGKNGTSSMAPQASTRSPTDMNLQVVTSTAASETTGSSSSSESHEGKGKGKGKGKRHHQKDHHHGSKKNKRSVQNPSADQMKRKSKKKASTKSTTPAASS